MSGHGHEGRPDTPRTPRIVWEFGLRLLLLTDTHIGAAQTPPRHAAESDVDLLVDRDPRTGVPRLRATTLAGLLRHELVERTGGPGPARALLGSAAPAAGSGPGPGTSALDIDDGNAELPEGAGVTVRTGTRVDPETGAVRPGRTWQWEVLPAGTVFTVPMRLHVPGPEDEAGLLGLLILASAGLDGTGPGRHVGGRTGRGYGRMRAAHWNARRHDLAGERGWFAYHARTWEERWAEAAAPGGTAGGAADAADALTRCLDTVGPAPVAARARAVAAGHPDRRHRAELRLRLAVAEHPGPRASDAGAADPDGTGLRPGLLMIGDAPADGRLGEVDRAHRYRPAPAAPARSARPAADDGVDVDLVPVLGDTALFALVKRIGERLARDAAEHLGGDPARWRAWNASWWGSDAEESGPRPSPAFAQGGASRGAELPPSSVGLRPQPSRIRLRAAPAITGGAPLTTTRLTVDALFGDAVDGRLYTSDLHCGGSADVVLDVRDPDDAVRGMLALVVRELATVPFDTLGSGGGSGNGRLTATRASLTTVPGDGGPPHTVDVLEAVRHPDTEDGRTARRWLVALRARLGPDRPAAAGPSHSTASEEEPHR
ncbi:RAMP superfamily CRISPR-associated protein [Nocardiopsis sp. YSL2]|uniref:RAMP superfamily CRISPR-associated protein n=1 Tax=Nocardiopsis sp. YSL2 TaxID=2939492 RepID=UPI0026F467C9|nr:RAMP superfamily CRISPR-associated protein [Nocardiopsis sp. YSL2]